ncbi:MAG: hypothetical protein A3G76_07665 [Acidobacteria bacterium RIFCSPLOWO2_12_FULL_65_11]|nr:MAG: hypothetical protein A3H95_16510 [Acidobacteria bacterium RIFCSPLOWO2_02_FULL_64_15]OFW29159.1 MAG: hypothetical protein A3G76_07665 [Acidobacteria bacterium RIFCSPLOWO2_12_FULL_65_11]
MYALASSFFLLALFAARYLSDTDLGYHLKGGQWILENRRFPSTDVYTYTRSSADYLDLHWLYQVLIYSMYRVGGYTSLSLLNIVLVALAFSLTLKRFHMTGAPSWMCALLLLVAVLSCELRFHMRPEILTWILMSLMLYVLEIRSSQKRNVLFLLPLIQVIWTNSEGLFGIGWGVMGFYLVSDLVHSSKINKPLWRYSLLAVASSLLNPYVFRGALLPFTYLATLDAASPFKQSIAEFQSPWSMGSRFTTPELTLLSYKLYFFFLLFLLASTFRKRKLHEFLLVGVFSYLSATTLRNIPLFMLATLPLAATSWKELNWDWLKRFQSSTVSKPAAAWIFILILLGVASRTVTSAQYVSEGRLDRFGLGLDGETQPVHAAEFLVRNQLEGRILNQVNTGGWLDWRRPGQVLIDGRTEVMGEELWVENMASLNPGGLHGLIAKYQPDILFFNPATARQWILDLNKLPDWRLVYLDEAACVFLRKDYAPQIPPLDEDRLLAERGLSKDVSENALSLLREPAPQAWKSFGESFYRPAVHPNGLQRMAVFFHYRGDFQMSEPLFLECIRRSRGVYYDFYFNAGLMYYSSLQYDKCRICMQRVLQDDPGNSGARQILENLGVS